jgi:hypothetical protein
METENIDGYEDYFQNLLPAVTFYGLDNNTDYLAVIIINHHLKKNQVCHLLLIKDQGQNT